jgi:hypothetical protein
MYVCANKVYYLSGDDPAQMQQDVVSDAHAVKGTLNYIEPGEIAEITRRHAVWMTDRGFVVGAPGGTLQHVTEADFTFPVSAAGALGKVKHDGVTTLVGTMKSPTDGDNNFGLADRVSIEIIRNKVV